MNNEEFDSVGKESTIQINNLVPNKVKFPQEKQSYSNEKSSFENGVGLKRFEEFDDMRDFSKIRGDFGRCSEGSVCLYGCRSCGLVVAGSEGSRGIYIKTSNRT